MLVLWQDLQPCMVGPTSVHPSNRILAILPGSNSSNTPGSSLASWPLLMLFHTIPLSLEPGWSQVVLACSG